MLMAGKVRYWILEHETESLGVGYLDKVTAMSSNLVRVLRVRD